MKKSVEFAIRRIPAGHPTDGAQSFVKEMVLRLSVPIIVIDSMFWLHVK